MVSVWSAMNTVASRAVVAAFAATATMMLFLLPLPARSAARGIDANAEAVEAVHAHPVLALRDADTFPPAGPIAAIARSRPKLHCDPQPMSASMPLVIPPGV